MRWFTSDHHFGHERICELAERPFADVGHMNREMLRLWNKSVAVDDIVFILGDLCMGRLGESLQLVSQLHGTKLLVPGNHDRVSSLYDGNPARKAAWNQDYLDAGIFVVSEQVTVALRNGQSVDLCHFPYTSDSRHDVKLRKVAAPPDLGRWLLHGHTHAKHALSGERQLHVGVDAWGYMPVSEDTVMQMVAL